MIVKRIVNRGMSLLLTVLAVARVRHQAGQDLARHARSLHRRKSRPGNGGL